MPNRRSTPARTPSTVAPSAASTPVAATRTTARSRLAAASVLRSPTHDQGAFDFEGLRPSSGKIDSEMEINRAEHFTDFFVIDALRNHPQRVFQPHLAHVHILAVLPFS